MLISKIKLETLLAKECMTYSDLSNKSRVSRITIEGQIYSVQMIDDPMGRNQHLEIYLKYTGGQAITQ